MRKTDQRPREERTLYSPRLLSMVLTKGPRAATIRVRGPKVFPHQWTGSSGESRKGTGVDSLNTSGDGSSDYVATTTIAVQAPGVARLAEGSSKPPEVVLTIDPIDSPSVHGPAS